MRWLQTLRGLAGTGSAERKRMIDSKNCQKSDRADRYWVLAAHGVVTAGLLCLGVATSYLPGSSTSQNTVTGDADRYAVTDPAQKIQTAEMSVTEGSSPAVTESFESMSVIEDIQLKEEQKYFLLGNRPLDTLDLNALPVLTSEMARIRDWVSAEYSVSSDQLEPIFQQAISSAADAGFDPILIIAVMAIESGFDATAVSHKGAQGLMQIIPRWHKDKIGDDADDDVLFDPQINVRVGTQVLAEAVKRFGSLQSALQYYAGARNDPKARYTQKVLAMQRLLMEVSVNRDAINNADVSS